MKENSRSDLRVTVNWLSKNRAATAFLVVVLILAGFASVFGWLRWSAASVRWSFALLCWLCAVGAGAILVRSSSNHDG